ncbi:ATP-binding protein [Aliivibrio fischeri]|uniref:ATP-binding protein n=1 Tax=Aliivibrio fischeri TaxID=668 RepID=UPI0012DAE0D4|nr:ATP-binding protein [Aliivibrio fischeri]MUK43331.1 ATP-binding protein [Aliivibrio fischeri]
MIKIVKDLITSQKEGLWWDFKEQFHKNIIDLLHDIICMSNVICSNDRYIIFGVNDACEIVGIDESTLNYTQADIIDYLRKSSFSENNIPTIEFDVIDFENRKLAILKIKNKRLKPFYLTQNVKKQGKELRAGVIYSRIGDTNTPKDSCSNPHDVAMMWKERFGLDLTAKDKFSYILLDMKNWQYDGISHAYYTLDPDYTIEIGEEESGNGNYWWQNIYFEKPMMYSYVLKFKNAEIYEIPIIHYRNENLKLPFPAIKFITYPNKCDGLKADSYCDLLYLQKDTIEYCLFEHIRTLEVHCTSYKTLSTPIENQIKPAIIKLPFFIVEDESEINELEKKCLLNYPRFMEERENILKGPKYSNIEINHHHLERAFAEWIFEEFDSRI